MRESRMAKATQTKRVFISDGNLFLPIPLLYLTMPSARRAVFVMGVRVFFR